MKRKSDASPPTRILSFGALSPTEHADLVFGQLRAAHRYQNDLARIERDRRAAWRGIHAEHPEIAPLVTFAREAEAALVAALRALKDKRSGDGRRGDRAADEEGERTVVKPLREKLWAAEAAVTSAGQAARKRVADVVEGDPLSRAAKEVAKAAAGRLGPRSKERSSARSFYEATRAESILRAADSGTVTRADADLVLGLHACEERVADLIKRTRAACGCTPGTYGLVDRAAEAFRRDWKTRPAITPFEGEGRIGAHFSKGISAAVLLGTGAPALRIRDPIAPTRLRKGESNRGSVAKVVGIHVGPDGRKPVLALFPMLYQARRRPIPSDGVCKDAWVLARRVGPRIEWRVQFAVEAESFRKPATPIGAGRVALDLGWRQLLDASGVPTGAIRCGYWVDEAGGHGEILLPAKVRSGIEKAESLRSIRDRHFDVARGFVREYLAAIDKPDWLVAESRFLGSKRPSTRKLVRLLRRWSSASERVPGDEVLLDGLRAWAKKDRHIWAWEAHQRDRRIHHRRETWRKIAADFAQRYAEIVVGDMDLRDFLVAPLPEEGLPAEGKTQRYFGHLAAVGEFRVEISRRTDKYGSRYVEQRMTWDTRWCACPDCGYVNLEWDTRARYAQVCAGCQRPWDQDHLGALNRLRRASGERAPLGPGALAEGNVQEALDSSP